MPNVGRAVIKTGIAATLIAVVVGCASAGNPEPGEEKTVEASGQSMEEMFAGRFPGVQVAKVASGGITIQIRGSNSVYGSSEPLYIIDGTRVQSGPGGLLFLDPAEIKKIEVLKDIGSTSIYGSEGANGVIIITTKRAIR